MNLAAIYLTPETISAGVGILVALWQSIRAKKYADAADALVTGIEKAARFEGDAKKAVALSTTGTVAATINSILKEKGWLK